MLKNIAKILKLSKPVDCSKEHTFLLLLYYLHYIRNYTYECRFLCWADDNKILAYLRIFHNYQSVHIFIPKQLVRFGFIFYFSTIRLNVHVFGHPHPIFKWFLNGARSALEISELVELGQIYWRNKSYIVDIYMGNWHGVRVCLEFFFAKMWYRLQLIDTPIRTYPRHLDETPRNNKSPYANWKRIDRSDGNKHSHERNCDEENRGRNEKIENNPHR